MKKGFVKHIDVIFPVMRHIFPSAVNILKSDDNHQDPSTVPLWKEAYYSLVLFEKILVQFPELCLGKDLEVHLFTFCSFRVYINNFVIYFCLLYRTYGK